MCVHRSQQNIAAATEQNAIETNYPLEIHDYLALACNAVTLMDSTRSTLFLCFAFLYLFSVETRECMHCGKNMNLSFIYISPESAFYRQLN